MTDTFAAYVRTSTEDNQSPDDSRRWQISLAEQLIKPHGGQIVSVYHDIDVSRSLPWQRRPEANRLLADVADRHRGWNRLVIGEPQRAFAGPQFQLVFPILSHYGVELWVPEIGGAVDPDSEAHDLVMSLFGGLSKAERRRIQHRTRASMLALANSGRWLGGRPNYGYRIVNTEHPHPNKSKASAGTHLRTLEPDPATAPVVLRIFELFDQGVGYRSIAVRLETEGIPSPGEVGPTRHPRSAGVWGGSAVRAILSNPRYIGHQVAGRQRRFDELLSTADPALGTVSRQRWQGEDNWSWSEEPSWPALVPKELFDRVNARITNSPSTNVRRPKTELGKYLFSGAIRCGHCGKAMYGITMKGKPYYRCTATRPDYATPSVEGHPPSYFVREERIVTSLDAWLREVTQPKRLRATVAAIVEADKDAEVVPSGVTRAIHDRARLEEELNRMLAAVRAGMDPALAAATTRSIQSELKNAESVLDRWGHEHPKTAPLDAKEVSARITEARGIVDLLATADRPERASFYQALCIELRYENERQTGRELIRARSTLRSGGGRI
jgi:site-specific DNA recombinase